MNKQFSKDLYRYYGEKGENFAKRLLRPVELKYIALFRKANSARFKPLKLYYTVKFAIFNRITKNLTIIAKANSTTFSAFALQ